MNNSIFEIQNHQILELKAMVDNLISDYQYISGGSPKFSILQDFQTDFQSCKLCMAGYQRLNNFVITILTDISHQIVGLGNFTITILDNLSRHLENNEQIKDSIQMLQQKIQKNHLYISELQHQNQHLKQKLLFVEQILIKNQNQIAQSQFLNLQLSNIKNELQTKLISFENQIFSEKESAIKLLQKQLTSLKGFHTVMAHEKMELQKQIIHLNQELINSQKSSQTVKQLTEQYPDQYTKKTHEQHSNSYGQYYNFDIVDQNLYQKATEIYFGELVQQFEQSPLKKHLKSLQNDIGSDRTFDFNLQSPQQNIQKLQLQIQSRIKIVSSLKEPGNFKINLFQMNKQNLNPSNKKPLQDLKQINLQDRTGYNRLDQGLKKAKTQNNQSFKTIPQTSTKAIQVDIRKEGPLRRNHKKLNKKAETSNNHQQAQLINGIKQKIKESTVESGPGSLFFKLTNYLSDKCIRNRIKAKPNSMLQLRSPK